jgi:hypothetical protein
MPYRPARCPTRIGRRGARSISPCRKASSAWATRFAATTSPSFNAGALYDVNFFMVRHPEGWRISCEGDTDLYGIATDGPADTSGRTGA